MSNIATTVNDLPLTDISSVFNVKQIDTHKYIGVKPLTKQYPSYRGVFGGNLVGQSILVAIRSAPTGFQPNAIHSYFVRAVSDETPVEWKVDETSNGRTFANRAIRGLQNGKVVFTANISLTSKNSTKDAITKTGQAPLKFQRQAGAEFQYFPNNIAKCPILINNPNIHNTVRVFTKVESRDEYPFLMKYGDEFRERIVGWNQDYQYVALSAISDWIRLENVFANMGMETDVAFNVSLDHSIHFHDNDFDASKYLFYAVKATRLSHDRVLINGQVFNEKGVHVASVSQERLFVLKNKPKI
ncbi:Acyl-CoA thioesterase Tes4p, putative [Candida maltosa Xu316]|uniref:Acyl-CoA thioesterase Tes4p, putative n=1 Tax=Candida maltosa (strain Xu316) TaxID=1245528 RepID=M3IVJ8_CANMX|nr:Acyl-CoA thioesterase Tes4p, putative [Candida maltosa Xu316]